MQCDIVAGVLCTTSGNSLPGLRKSIGLCDLPFQIVCRWVSAESHCKCTCPACSNGDLKIRVPGTTLGLHLSQISIHSSLVRPLL